MQLDGFITGMCCQVIRPDPCKSRCGRIFFFFLWTKEGARGWRGWGKKGDWETWRIQFMPPPARWYSVPQCDCGRLRSVQIKENAMMWNVIKKLSLRRWHNFDRIGWVAEREPRRIVSAPPKPLSAQLRMRFADFVVSCDSSWFTARRRIAHLQVWMHWWCWLVQEGQLHYAV